MSYQVYSFPSLLTSSVRTYHLPRTLRPQSEGAKLDALEEFWESEVARVGEPDAKGWAAWFDSGKPEPTAFPPPRKPDHDISHMDPYIRWSAQELQDDKISILPRRSIDEDESSDPYATILFSDIRPLLFSLTSVPNRQAFRLIWLSFLGLNIPGFVGSLSETPTENSDDRWASKHLTSSALLQAIFPSSSTKRITADAQAGVLIGREPEYTSIFGPVKNSSIDVLKPLDIIGKMEWATWAQQDLDGVDEEIVREVFRMCRFQQDETEWDILMLAFETAVNSKKYVPRRSLFYEITIIQSLTLLLLQCCQKVEIGTGQKSRFPPPLGDSRSYRTYSWSL